MTRAITNIYQPRRNPYEAITDLGNAFGEFGKAQRQNRLSDLAMRGNQLKFDEQQRQLNQEQAFRSRVQGMSTSADAGEFMDIYKQEMPMKYADQKIKSFAGKGDTWVNMLNKPGWVMNKKTGAMKSIAQSNSEAKADNLLRMSLQMKSPDLYARAKALYKQSNSESGEILPEVMDLEFSKAWLERDISPDKIAKLQLAREKQQLDQDKMDQRIYEFDNTQGLREQERLDELAKPDVKRAFDQETYLKQVPELLWKYKNPKQMLTPTMVKDINKTTNDVSDMNKKISDFKGMITGKDFGDLKFGKFMGDNAVVASQYNQIITDYNTKIAKLGALAGADLSILTNVLPDPADLTNTAMKEINFTEAIDNLQKNIRENYRLVMKNAGFNVSDNILDEFVSSSRATPKAPEAEQTSTTPTPAQNLTPAQKTAARIERSNKRIAEFKANR